MTEHYMDDERADEIEKHVDSLPPDEKRVYIEKIVRNFDDDNDLVLDSTSFTLDTMKGLCYTMSERFAKINNLGKDDVVSVIWRAIAKKLDQLEESDVVE